MPVDNSENLKEEVVKKSPKISFKLTPNVLKILKLIAISIIFAIIVFIVAYLVASYIVALKIPPKISAIEKNDENAILEWYKDIKPIQTNTSGKNLKRILVQLHLVYDKLNKKVGDELLERTPKITDLIRRFFSEKTPIELQNEDIIKRELLLKINNIMTSGEIRDIAFLKLEIN